jgi:hypothetical protein
MKPLTERQAARCENATHSRCRCRCKGVAHGRGKYFRFDDLPEHDLHKVVSSGKRSENGAGPRAQSGSNVGLTDQTTSDLYGIVAPPRSLEVPCALDAGKDEKSLSGGCRGAKPPTHRTRAERLFFT